MPLKIILVNRVSNQEIILKGVPICRGIAIGNPYFFSLNDEAVIDKKISPNEVDTEIQRYKNALELSRRDLVILQAEMEAGQMQEGVSILEAELLMMQDPLLTAQVENEIRHAHRTAEASFHKVVMDYQKRFNSLDNAFFRERFKEIQDISRRVLGHLRSSIKLSLANIPPGSVVFSQELAAADTAEAHMSAASAFITELGGATSHAAIVAKARGTPYVSNISFAGILGKNHQTVIVDGRTGEIILNPSPETLSKYQKIRDLLNTHVNKLNQTAALQAETYDGYSIRLSANIESVSDLDLLHKHGGNGVGLYRSEYLCLSKEQLPTEEDQFAAYQALVEKMEGLPIVIRTFDIGGDKELANQKGSVLTTKKEGNPFLGCRAIRYLLQERDLFKKQLRAILRAAAYGDVSVMFPMVSTLSELRDAKDLVLEAQLELEQQGLAHGKIRIGCMIEVPSAAIIADLLARECDFLSIGTNDLVQYALAVDRGNQAMHRLYTPAHPSIIRMIKLIIQEANHQGIPVSICGEVAADPRFTPLLLGLGIHELSVAGRYIPTVKHAVRNTSIIAANLLAEAVLKLTTAGEIQELLTQDYKKNVPDDAFYNC